MQGLFLGNGPLRVSRPAPGTGPDNYLIGLNKEGSWLDNADVLYIDQPVDAGFSYGDSVLNTMADGAAEFIKFLE